MYFPNWSRTNLASVCPSPTTCLAQLWVGWARFFCCNPHLCKALNSVFLGHLLVFLISVLSGSSATQQKGLKFPGYDAPSGTSLVESLCVDYLSRAQCEMR